MSGSADPSSSMMRTTPEPLPPCVGYGKRCRRVHSVHYVYTVVQVGGTIHFILDAADPHARTPSGQPDQSGVWEVYPYRTEPMVQALGDGGREGTEAASTEVSS